MVGYKLNIEEHGDTLGDWNSHNCSEAQQLLASITSFDFIDSVDINTFHISQGSL